MPQKDPYHRREQKIFDTARFDRNYPELPPTFAKVRHIGEHVGKAIAKLYEHSSAVDRDASERVISSTKRRITHEAIPDLAVYRTQLANTLYISLEKSLERRSLELPGTIPEAIGSLAVARAYIDNFTEPLAHRAHATRESKENIRYEVIPRLHYAAEGLAQQFGIEDISKAHANRLLVLAGQPGLSA